MSGDLLSHYRSAPDGYDELLGPDGAPRAHWRPALEALQGLGPEALRRCQSEARRVLHGRATPDTSPGGGAYRSWALNLLPYRLTESEWDGLAVGLRQRAELLDRVLADLYGPRNLLHRGLLPPELVLAHRGFLRPCAGLPRQGPRSLPLYAADLARTAEGGWCVLADRAQAPGGLGYALEARAVMAQVLPSLMRAQNPHALDDSLTHLRRAIAAAAPQDSEARGAVLSPGPFNPAYLDHAVLAHRLGYPLAHGFDLTVLDGRLLLRTVDGTRPIDVLLRRVDDEYCDPLELRKDSLLGAPGFVQSVRRGALGVVNPLGSGVLENPGLAAYLPRLADELLGESLVLGSPTTWWCGDPGSRQQVLERLERLVIHTLDDGTVHVGSAMDEGARAALAAAIEAYPQRFVGQEMPRASQAPVLNDGRLEPRRVALRLQVASGQDGEYHTLPGGVAQEMAGALPGGLGGSGQDIWVVAEQRPAVTQPAAAPPAPISRAAAEVPSRAAENLFWMGRYFERAERHVRLMREIVTRSPAGTSGIPGEEPVLRDLLAALTHVTGSYPGFVGTGAQARLADPGPELVSLISDATRAGSLRGDVAAVARAAAEVRDLVSEDTARSANRLQDVLDVPERWDDLVPILDRLLAALTTFADRVDGGLAPGSARALLDVGRYLERAFGVVRALRPTLLFTAPADASVSEALLTTTGTMTRYRHRGYVGQPTPASVLEVLVCDAGHARSLVTYLQRLRARIGELPVVPDVTARAHERVEAAMAAARAIEPRDPAEQPQLGQRLDAVESALNAVSDALAEGYFQREALPQQMVTFQ